MSDRTRETYMDAHDIMKIESSTRSATIDDDGEI